MLRYWEGFDYISDTEEATIRTLEALGWYNDRFSLPGNNALFITENTAFGLGKSLRMGSNGSTGTPYIDTDIVIGAEISEGYFGGRFFLDSNAIATGFWRLQFKSVFGDVISLVFNQGGVINIWKGDPQAGGTPLGRTVAGAYPEQVWFYLEVYWNIDADDGAVEVRINTVPKAQYFSINTAGLGNIELWGFSIRSNASTYSGGIPIFGFLDIDDVYINDTTGTENNTWLGNTVVRGSSVDGVGDSTEWNRSDVMQANWENASNDQINDDLYVYSDVEDDYDLYTVAPVYTSPIIFGVGVKGFYRQTDGTQLFANNVLKSDTTEVDGDADATMSTYYHIRDVWELDPHTGMVWAPADANAIQIGPKVSGGLT